MTVIKEQQTFLPAIARVSMIKQALFEEKKSGKALSHRQTFTNFKLNNHFYLAGLIYSRKENY